MMNLKFNKCCKYFDDETILSADFSKALGQKRIIFRHLLNTFGTCLNLYIYI